MYDGPLLSPIEAYVMISMMALCVSPMETYVMTSMMALYITPTLA
jgi:hypothetical protein